ncbi:hypothetical protein ACFLXI_02355 [Chloroflexota bacterium]
MSTLASNKSESQYVLYNKDGLLDIFIGLGIFFAGLFLWTEMVWMAGVFIPIFLPSFKAARKRFLLSRIGSLDQDQQQQGQAQKLIFSGALLLGVILLVGIGLFFAFGFMSGAVNEWLRQYFLLIIGIIFATVWVFAGVLLRINRYYLYAVFTIIAMFVAQFTAIPFWSTLAVLGGLITLVGLFILIRFLQQNPAMK